MLNKTILSALLAVCSFSAVAADYYVVLPIPGKSAVVADISVGLNNVTLPSGVVGDPYVGYDLKSALVVTGDAAYDPATVRWAVVSGALPLGLNLNSTTGVISGTPTVGGDTTFSVKATYKTKTGQSDYRILVADITLVLAAATLPVTSTGAAYSFDFKPSLSVSGDSNYNANNVVWAAASLPGGLSMSAGGILAGTAPALTAQGQAIAVSATYKSRVAQRTYTLLPGDASAAQVTLHMHMNGADGATDFVDQKGAAYTRVLTPTVSADAKYGTGAGKFGSTGYIYSAAKPFAAVGTGDFTVEFWVKIGALGTIGDHDYAAMDFNPIQIGLDSSKKLHFEKYGFGWNTVVSSVALDTSGAWTHVAIARQAGTTRMFFNGAQVAANTRLSGQDLNQVGNMIIGARAGGGTRTSTGWFLFDDVRFTVGTARYTAEFTPPAAELPN